MSLIVHAPIDFRNKIILSDSRFSHNDYFCANLIWQYHCVCGMLESGIIEIF